MQGDEIHIVRKEFPEVHQVLEAYQPAGRDINSAGGIVLIRMFINGVARTKNAQAADPQDR